MDEDPNYPVNKHFKMWDRITATSYMDEVKWMMIGTKTNKLQTKSNTYREISQHRHYNKAGYTGAQLQDNMRKRIWHRQELHLMMVQCLDVSETSNNPTENDMVEKRLQLTNQKTL